MEPDYYPVSSLWSRWFDVRVELRGIAAIEGIPHLESEQIHETNFAVPAESNRLRLRPILLWNLLAFAVKGPLAVQRPLL